MTTPTKPTARERTCSIFDRWPLRDFDNWEELADAIEDQIAAAAQAAREEAEHYYCSLLDCEHPIANLRCEGCGDWTANDHPNRGTGDRCGPITCAACAYAFHQVCQAAQRAREEEHAPMECGHPKACWGLRERHLSFEECLACAREARVRRECAEQVRHTVIGTVPTTTLNWIADAIERGERSGEPPGRDLTER